MLLYGFVYEDSEFSDPMMYAVTDSGYTVSSTQRGLLPTVDRAPDWRLSRERQAELATMIDMLRQSRSQRSKPPLLIDVAATDGDWSACVDQFIDAAYSGQGVLGSAEEFARRSLPLAIGRTQTAPEPVRFRDGREHRPRLVMDVQDVDVLKAANRARMHVALVGPPGTGKTTSTFAAFGEDLIMLGCYDGMAREDVVGALLPVPGSAGQFDWVDGPLLQAMKEGRPLLIDDAMWMPPGVQAMLHSVMDDSRRITVMDRPGDPVVIAQPGFTIIATVNPGLGYGLSTPVLNRTQLVIDVPVNFDAIADRVPPTLLTLAQARLRRAADSQDHTLWVPSQRELADAAATEAVFGLDFAAAALVSKCPADQRSAFEMDAAEALVVVNGPLIALSP